MELTWTGTGDSRSGWCGGFHIGQVLRGPGGWCGYVAHDHIDDRRYATPDEAIAAVDLFVADRPDPTPGPPPERRRHVANRGPERAPHPGVLERPPG